VHATRIATLSLLDLITLIISDEEYELWSSSIFSFLQSRTTSSLLKHIPSDKFIVCAGWQSHTWFRRHVGTLLIYDIGMSTSQCDFLLIVEVDTLCSVWYFDSYPCPSRMMMTMMSNPDGWLKLSVCNSMMAAAYLELLFKLLSSVWFIMTMTVEQRIIRADKTGDGHHQGNGLHLEVPCCCVLKVSWNFSCVH